MKSTYFALGAIALLLAATTVEQTQALQLSADIQFTDEIQKALEEDDHKESLADTKSEAKADEKKEVKTEKKVDEKKDEKKTEKKDNKKKKEEDDDVPMDNAAIKAYSSVIADAAEDSEPEKPVVYGQVGEELNQRSEHPPIA